MHLNCTEEETSASGILTGLRWGAVTGLGASKWWGKKGSESGSHMISFRKVPRGDPKPMITGPAEGHGERSEEWDTVRRPERGHGCARGDEASLPLGKKKSTERECAWEDARTMSGLVDGHPSASTWKILSFGHLRHHYYMCWIKLGLEWLRALCNHLCDPGAPVGPKQFSMT